LYGKGLRRLRTLCGRTPNLPGLFEVQETFVEDPPTPICQTGMSDVHRAKNERRVVALKTIRSNDEGIETYKRVRTAFSLWRSMPDYSTQVWRKEAIVWQLLHHPHVVPFLGILGRNSSLKLVSEWMEYGQLTTYLKARPSESPIRYVCLPTKKSSRMLT
jgi:serine/threonine protein kinase